MVAGYQRRPPWAVGMRSVFSPFAIAARLLPAARSRLIRSIVYGDMVGGRPSRTPCERLMASASLVRCEIERRSQGEGGEQGRDRLLGRRRRGEGAVEGDERPALLLRGRDQGGEVEQRAREPDLLRGDERVRVSALEYPQRFLDPPPLRFEAGAPGALPAAPHLTTPSTCMGPRSSCATTPLTAGVSVAAIYSKQCML